MTELNATTIHVNYDTKEILHDVSLDIPEGKITTFIGPNGSGKSTLLKSLARILKPTKGAVYLDQALLQDIPTKEVAKKIAMLAQSTSESNNLTVKEIVTYGRSPYQKGFGGLRQQDHEKINWAIQVTQLAHLATTPIQSLSGGQRQRVWIAMALAQDTDILILDEPTTYLDPAHQLDILLLLKEINHSAQKTIIMSLHDLNHTARFSDCVFALKNGQILFTGTSQEVFTASHMQELFDIEATFVMHPKEQYPVLLSYDLLERTGGGL